MVKAIKKTINRQQARLLARYEFFSNDFSHKSPLDDHLILWHKIGEFNLVFYDLQIISLELGR